MTDQPTGPPAPQQRIAMRISAATVPFTPGMDPANPLHVLRIEFGPLATEIMIPESNVQSFLDSVGPTLLRQVDAARAERLGAQQQGLLVPPGPLHADDVNQLMRQVRQSRAMPLPPELRP